MMTRSRVFLGMMTGENSRDAKERRLSLDSFEYEFFFRFRGVGLSLMCVDLLLMCVDLLLMGVDLLLMGVGLLLLCVGLLMGVGGMNFFRFDRALFRCDDGVNAGLTKSFEEEDVAFNHKAADFAALSLS